MWFSKYCWMGEKYFYVPVIWASKIFKKYQESIRLPNNYNSENKSTRFEYHMTRHTRQRFYLKSRYHANLILAEIWIMQTVNYCSQAGTTTWTVSKYGVFSGMYFPVFGLNAGKYGPGKTPYLDTFHAVDAPQRIWR